MDISPSYNCLLGRPWIHIAGAVPSTLHQKIKFVTEGQLVCIATEEDTIATASSGAPYVKVDEKAMECSFRFLKFVNAMYVKERAKILMPKLSKVTHLGIKQVPGKGARAEKRLGKRKACWGRSLWSRKRIDSGWDTSPIDKKGRDLSKKRDRKELPVSSRKREKAQKWTYHHWAPHFS